MQYAKWFGLVLQGDLGNSIYGSRIPVSQLLIEAAPRTFSLAVLAFVVSVLIAIPAGLVSALRRGRPIDHGVTFIAFLGLSMPDFWLGILLIILFAASLGWLPAIGYEPLSNGFWPWLSHLILPAIAAGTAFTAIIARMVRSSMLEVLKTDYVRVADGEGPHAVAGGDGPRLPQRADPGDHGDGHRLRPAHGRRRWWWRPCSPSRALAASSSRGS